MRLVREVNRNKNYVNQKIVPGDMLDDDGYSPMWSNDGINWNGGAVRFDGGIPAGSTLGEALETSMRRLQELEDMRRAAGALRHERLSRLIAEQAQQSIRNMYDTAPRTLQPNPVWNRLRRR